MNRTKGFCLFFTILGLLLLWSVARGQVLGPCDSGTRKAAAATPAQAPAPAPAPAPRPVQRMLLPGEKAMDFALPAVVGDEIKMVKLSDFDRKWRLVCFYPADFTFV